MSDPKKIPKPTDDAATISAYLRSLGDADAARAKARELEANS